MKRDIIFSSTLLLFVLMMQACNRPETLLQGEWEMKWTFVNGDRQEEQTTLTWTLLNDGVFFQKTQSPVSNEELKGEWSYDKEANVLTLSYITTGSTVDWQIIKLERDYMELNHTTRGFFVERAFDKRQ